MKFIQSEDPADFAKEIDEKTKGIYVESIGNPRNTVADLPGFAKACLSDTSPILALIFTSSASLYEGRA